MMKKEQLKFDATTFEVLFLFIGVALIHAVLADAIENPDVVTYIGAEGLLSVRQRLLLYLASRVLRIFLPLLCILFSGFLVHLFHREPLRPSKLRLLAGLGCCLIGYPLALKHRTGFELQCELNGYRGIRPLQAIALLADVQKDLQESAAPDAETLCAEIRKQNYPYHVGSGRHSSGSRHSVYEYALLDAASGKPVAQITKADYQRAAKICSFAEHEVAVYPHSGFIAAFDGGALTRLDDFETLFTLTYDPQTHTVQRTANPRENAMRQIYMIVERDGVQIGQIGIQNRTAQYFTEGLNTRIWLEMTYEGKTVRVSNILSF